MGLLFRKNLRWVRRGSTFLINKFLRLSTCSPPQSWLSDSVPHACLSQLFRICGDVERSTTTCVSICTFVPVKQVLLYLCRTCRTSEHVDRSIWVLTRAPRTLDPVTQSYFSRVTGHNPSIFEIAKAELFETSKRTSGYLQLNPLHKAIWTHDQWCHRESDRWRSNKLVRGKREYESIQCPI